MDPATVVAVVSTVAAVLKQVADLGPLVIKGAQDARPFAELIVRTILGREVTEDELTLLEQQIKVLSDELQEPLPPADEEDI